MGEAELRELVETYKALADETRLRLLGLVAERPHTGKELAEALGVTAPVVSHHVEKLKRAGLLRELREGRARVYGLNRETLARLGRAQLEQSAVEAEPAGDRVLRDFFDGERLRSIPAQRKKRVVVLRELLRRYFAADEEYPEREVNDRLRRAHDDVATLRRELVMYGFLEREHGVYRVVERPPTYSRQVAQEIGTPADER
ncbi:MAG TPA: metalloregulator ArsR/SmtB family transcription factor [Thermomicrobiaceae bacterium]|nr:metalloregulator ArsR/SmtB family transcription factor [Thermomicrobiaceae bacterium]